MLVSEKFTNKYLNRATPAGRVNLESIGLIPAELTSMVVSLGVVAVADDLAPDLVKGASKFLGKHIFLPHLEKFESVLSNVCKVDDCQVDKTKSREERAENLARVSVVFSAAWVASMAAKVVTRRVLNKRLGVDDNPVSGAKPWQFWKVSNHEKIVLGLDEGVHYGSLILMNTVGAPVNNKMINATKSVLMSAGLPENKARDMANMAVIWEVPNFLGLGAGIGAIAGIHHKQWDKKFEKSISNLVANKPPDSFTKRVARELAFIPQRDM